MPNLHNKKVLITREKSQAKIFSNLIIRHGGIPIEIPLIDIICKDMETIENRHIFNMLDRYNWIFFTSANGVHSFFNLLNKDDNNQMTLLRYAAVGSKTELALREQGYHAEFIPTTYNAEVMAKEFLAKYSTDTRILLVRGSRSRSVLPDQFIKHGVPFESVEVYETVYNFNSKEQLNIYLTGNEIDFITFTSPSTVNAFIQMTDATDSFQKVCICIGTTTEKCAQKHGFKNTIIPKSFTIEGMVKCMSNYLNRKKR